MHPDTKQHEAKFEDAAAALANASDDARDGGAGGGAAAWLQNYMRMVDNQAADGAVDAGDDPDGAADAVGALVLRGNRCVLVRSLATPAAWRGVRIPAVAPRDGEAPLDTALRAAMALTDIDDASEFVPLPRVPPVTLLRANGARTLVHVLYAANKPPPGPLEDADMSDDEDFYDWYEPSNPFHSPL